MVTYIKPKPWFGRPQDLIELAARDWLIENYGTEGEPVMKSLAALIRKYATFEILKEDAPMTAEHQPLPVAGYTPVSDEKVQLVNRNKEAEERLIRLCEEHMKRIDFDQRFVNIAFTHFQQGFMAPNRAVFQPTRVKLPEDGEPPQKQEPDPMEGGA